jgi:uncharacterized membrane protein YadS
LVFKNKNTKIKIPYFIAVFVLAMIANTYLPLVHDYSHYITSAAKATLTLTLFLIGCGLSKKVLVSVGFKPLIQGVIIWIIISVATLWGIYSLV